MDIDTREMVNAALDVLTDPQHGKNRMFRKMAEGLIIAAAKIRGYLPKRSDAGDRADSPFKLNA